MSKLQAQIGQHTYRFWIRIDSTSEFPEKVRAFVNGIRHNRRFSSHVRTFTDNRLICTAPLFDKVQADLDVMGSCTASLFAEDTSTHKMRKVIDKCKMYGNDKDNYDKLLRMIRS